MIKNLISLKDLSKEDIEDILKVASKIKKYPFRYSSKLKNKTLLMLFAKPSLRTHLSFEVAALQLGGHAIFYNMGDSTIGKKESVKDAVIVMSRYVDIIMARLYEHEETKELAHYSKVPVISGLDNFEHPCQVLGDLLTIKEKKKKLEGLTLTYIGDANNNVTNSLIFAADKLGIKLNIVCPKQFEPKLPGKYTLSHNPKDVKGDIVYTDTWFSYHVKESGYDERKANHLQWNTTRKS